jgi:hypothetical protein
MTNPWQFFWAPQLHLPFGGNVAQHIEPESNWFFAAIPRTAGDPTIEKEAFQVATYGRQLGLITELLMDLAKSLPPRTEKGATALERLGRIQGEIEQLKQRDASEVAQEVIDLVSQLKERHKDEYPRLRERIERALEER